MKNFTLFAGISCVALALAFPGQASQTDPVRNISSYALDKEAAGYVPDYDAYPVIANYASLVAATYEQALIDAKDLQSAIQVLLDNPTNDTLNAARNSWINARTSYLQTEAFRFYEGPIDFVDDKAGTEGPEGRLNAWPMNEGFIDYVEGNPDAGIINDLSIEITAESIREYDQVEDESDVTTGYHAIEFLLWGQDLNGASAGNRPVSDYIAGSEKTDRRRLYLKTVTEMLVKDLDGLVTAWNTSYPDSYAAKFKSFSDREALGRILTSLATLSEFELALERIATGLDSGDQEDEQSCFSDNTRNDMIYDQRGIRNVYFGAYGDVAGPGLDSLVARLAPDLNTKMIAALNRTDGAMAKLDHPYDTILASEADSRARQEAEAVITALQAQSDVIKDIGKLLGVRVVVPTGG
ncbi:imelysin family protein [uncultured Sneathiella sp.]|uniref:imelysin family protein n=1 Tax=uncultured Sneathiella sp. TaxID=879315 RepID=UPI0030EF4362|tara:strand:+ start:6603 stop:7832 length:1230 start_codon:yes stop_codon:yes gene_type:complete